MSDTGCSGVRGGLQRGVSRSRQFRAVVEAVGHDPVVDIEKLDWTKLRSVGSITDEVLPVAVQDVDTGAVVMVAYANRRAFLASMQHGQAVFWSTSKNELHHKGSSSGDFLNLVEVRVNCEANSLLYRVRLRGAGACHVKDEAGTAHRSYFFRDLAELV